MYSISNSDATMAKIITLHSDVNSKEKDDRLFFVFRSHNFNVL